MRTMARAVRGLAVLVIIIAVVALGSFVEARSTLIDSDVEDNIREGLAGGYYETAAISDIVNISDCTIANKLNAENGRIMIVREIETE